ncbi:MAG: TolB family protein, partial [Erythrobacter sp.]
MRPLAIIPSALIAALIAAVPAAAQDDLRPFTAEDVFELEWADQPQVSPDGKHALYVRRSNDAVKDRTLARVWLVALDGSSHEPLLAGEGSYSSPRWSPDGERIAYLRRSEGRTGLYVHWLGSGRTAFLGTFEDAPRNLEWSPDGAMIAF